MANATVTNVSLNSASVTNTSISARSITWGDANFTWAEGAGTWGNPYSMFEEGDSREEVIRKYQYDFERDLFPNKKKSEVVKLLGKRLGCYCAPAACHGDVLANYLNQLDDGQ